MSTALAEMLGRVVALPGVVSCALVDAETAMPLEVASGGGACPQVLCEAATEYWRLHERHRDRFDRELGTLAAQVIVHAAGRLTLVGCGDRLLLVTVSREPDRVAWAEWKPLVRKLQDLAANF